MVMTAAEYRLRLMLAIAEARASDCQGFARALCELLRVELKGAKSD